MQQTSVQISGKRGLDLARAVAETMAEKGAEVVLTRHVGRKTDEEAAALTQEVIDTHGQASAARYDDMQIDISVDREPGETAQEDEQPRPLQELAAVLDATVALAEERRKNCILLVQMIAGAIKANLDPDNDDAVTYLDVQISDWVAWSAWADVKVHEPGPSVFKAAIMVRISGRSFYLPLVVAVESDEHVYLGCDEDVVDKYPVADLDSKLDHMATSMGRRAAALLAQNVADIALVSRMLFKERTAG